MDFSRIEDNELYELMKREKSREGAFKEVYSRYSTRVFQYCRRILGNQTEAEDVFQDTFIAFLNSVSEERIVTNMPGFLLRIARNQSYNVKRENRQVMLQIDDLEIGFTEEKLEKTELSAMIVSAMDLLPDDQREALVLQMYEDMSYQEIAEFLDVPVSTVRNWLIRAKRKLKEILTPYMEGDIK